MNEIPPLNLSVDEAARILGIGERLMWTLIRKGEIPVVRIGDRVLIPYIELRRWNREHTAVPS